MCNPLILSHEHSGLATGAGGVSGYLILLWNKAQVITLCSTQTPPPNSVLLAAVSATQIIHTALLHSGLLGKYKLSNKKADNSCTIYFNQ